jgi:hypothetical protein
MGKRRDRDSDVDVDDIIDSMNLDNGLRLAFSELTADEQTALLADFANSASLPNSAFKKARVDLPSFCAAKWSTFAEEFGLPTDAGELKLKSFHTPKYQLPPSLHQAMFANAWRWQDVYREKIDQEMEEDRLRLLEPVCQPNSDNMRRTDDWLMMQYIVPIVALFQGRVIDKPEQAMLETTYSTGGEVKHKVSMSFLCASPVTYISQMFMVGGVLFFVIEFKPDRPTKHNLVQLLLELLCAYFLLRTHPWY